MDALQIGSLFPGDMGSEIFHLDISGHPVPVTAIPSVRAEDYAGFADEYAKLPSYCSINPPNFMGVHYAWIAADVPVDLTVSCPSAVERCIVHPARRQIQPAMDGKTIKARTGETEPRYFIFEIDDYPPLVVVVDPIERDAPGRDTHGVLDVGRLLSDSASVAERTATLEEAFHKAAKDKKIAYVPAGVYHVGAIKLHNLEGLTLYFASGSLLRTETSPAGKNIHSHGLWLQDSQHIRIWGRGCLDHGGYPNFAHGGNAYNHGLISYYVTNDLCPFTTESPLFMLRCRNVEIDGFMVRNGRNMNFNMRRCDDVTLRRCKILTPPLSTPEYGDGYHTNSCRNVRIEKCLAFCNDDCFASGHYTCFDDRDSANHVIHGLVGWNPRANAVRLGFHTYFNLGDYRFENCDFAGMAYAAIVIHPLKDAPEAHRFQRYGTVSFADCGFACGRLSDVLIDMADARMDAFELVDVAFDARRPIRIHGHRPGDGIKKLRLEGVTIAGEAMKAADVDMANVGGSG